jgi:EmrB/QacA subfamily drug resistance transporter
MAARYLSLSSARGRLVVLATVLGSGTVFLEMTVVNVALPSMARDMGLGITGLQWILDGYLLTLGALILLGGSLGDVFGRGRIFIVGLIGFAVTSVLAALAPSFGILIVLRLLQGAAGALLVPNSLALLETVFAEDERGRAIGQWAGWSGAWTAVGPLLGGALLEVTSWRAIFGVVGPFALLAAWLAQRSVPPVTLRSKSSVDYLGALLATTGLGGIITMLISGPVAGFSTPWVVAVGASGVGLLTAFLVHESRSRAPLLPLTLFRVRAFAGANLATFFVYAALGGLFFLLMLQLQNALGFSPLRAGASLLPINFLLLVLSPVAGALATRIGPRWPMTAGSIIAGFGMLLFARVQPEASYAGTILPALIVFGIGLGALVAPLTAAVLEAAPEESKGIASAFNNAVARLAGLIAIALLPLAAGMVGSETLRGEVLVRGFARAMYVSAGLCFAGAVVAFLTMPARTIATRKAVPTN